MSDKQASVLQLFGTFIFSAREALMQSVAGLKAAQAQEAIDAVIADELEELYYFMTVSIREASSLTQVQSNNRWLSYRYPDIAESTQERKDAISGSNGRPMPLKYLGYYRGYPLGKEKSLVGVLDQLNKQTDIGQALYDALGTYSPTKYQYQGRSFNINENKYDRLKGKFKGGARRWSDVVDPELVRQVREGVFRIRETKGSVIGNYFYDAVNKKRVSIARAIAEGRIRKEVRVEVSQRIFSKVQNNDYGFMLALMPLIAKDDAHTEAKIFGLRHHGRNFIDVFFGDVFERIEKRLDELKLDTANTGNL